MENAMNASCADFTAKLASPSPTPGGGGAAALTGALGAALCSMAARLTAGNGKFQAVKPRAEEIAARAEALRQRLLCLAEEDEKAFYPLSQAYSMDKSSPDYRSVFTAASLAACAPPMDMLRCVVDIIELTETMAEICSPMLISDVGCAAAACAAALRAAEMNVLVNTRSLKGNAEAEELARRAAELTEEYLPRAEAAARRVAEYLEG